MFEVVCFNVLQYLLSVHEVSLSGQSLVVVLDPAILVHSNIN